MHLSTILEELRLVLVAFMIREHPCQVSDCQRQFRLSFSRSRGEGRDRAVSFAPPLRVQFSARLSSSTNSACDMTRFVR